MSSTGTKNLPTSNDQVPSTYSCNPEFINNFISWYMLFEWRTSTWWSSFIWVYLTAILEDIEITFSYPSPPPRDIAAHPSLGSDASSYSPTSSTSSYPAPRTNDARALLSTSSSLALPSSPEDRWSFHTSPNIIPQSPQASISKSWLHRYCASQLKTNHTAQF